MSAGSTFLDGVLQHLQTFAQQRNISPDEVHVRLTLADTTDIIVRGLKVDGPHGTYNWGMIQGIVSQSADALLIGEDHVVTVEFQVEPIVRGPAGLTAESS